MSQGLGQTSAFNQQSMYLPTAPHPPPSAAPDMYPTSLSQYRIQVCMLYITMRIVWVQNLEHNN